MGLIACLTVDFRGAKERDARRIPGAEEDSTYPQEMGLRWELAQDSVVFIPWFPLTRRMKREYR